MYYTRFAMNSGRAFGIWRIALVYRQQCVSLHVNLYLENSKIAR